MQFEFRNGQNIQHITREISRKMQAKMDLVLLFTNQLIRIQHLYAVFIPFLIALPQPPMD